MQTTTPAQESAPTEKPEKKKVTIAGIGFSIGSLLAWVAILALLAVLALGLRRSQEGPIQIGKTVPDFSLTSFDGQEFRLSELNGKVVVVNFWASWCKPCEQEAADMETAWQLYKPGGEVVFLGVDYVDTEPEARAFMDKFGITYPNGPDLRTKISQSFRIRGVPETYIVDKQGNLAFKKIAPFSSLLEIQAAIDPLLQ